MIGHGKWFFKMSTIWIRYFHYVSYHRCYWPFGFLYKSSLNIQRLVCRHIVEEKQFVIISILQRYFSTVRWIVINVLSVLYYFRDQSVLSNQTFFSFIECVPTIKFSNTWDVSQVKKITRCISMTNFCQKALLSFHTVPWKHTRYM